MAKMIEVRSDNALFIVYFLRAIVHKIEENMSLTGDVEMLRDTADYIDSVLTSSLTSLEREQLLEQLRARIDQVIQ